MSSDFHGVTLEHLDAAELDDLSFGVVRMSLDGRVAFYNRAESEIAGLEPERVVGRHFFSEIGPCTNNFLVAQRMESATDLDETIDYVFTLRMAPTPVQLRMLKAEGQAWMYLLVKRA